MSEGKGRSRQNGAKRAGIVASPKVCQRLVFGWQEFQGGTRLFRGGYGVLLPVLRLGRDDVPDAAAGIGNVAGVAGDDVETARCGQLPGLKSGFCKAGGEGRNRNGECSLFRPQLTHLLSKG